MSSLVTVVDGVPNIGPAPDAENVANENFEAVKRFLNIKDNPDPDQLIVIVLIVFIVMYYIYISFVKTSLSGQWFDGRNTYTIHHDMWTDDLQFNDDSTGRTSGIIGNVRGDAVYIHMDGKWIGGLHSDGVIRWVNAPKTARGTGEVIWKQIQ